MYIHRNLMIHIACTSAILTAGLTAQQLTLRPTTAGQIGAAYNNPERIEVEKSQTETQNQTQPTPNQKRKTVAQTPGAAAAQNYVEQQNQRQNVRVSREENKTVQTQENSIRVMPGQDANRSRGERVSQRNERNDRRVQTTQERNPIGTREQIQIPTADRRALPGAGRNTITTTREVIAAPERPVRNDVSAPNRSARTVETQEINRVQHLMPGSRKAGVRPVVVQRNLPKKIVIDKRCAPCPYVVLTPYAVSKKGDVIELDDGSIWDVRHRDRHTVKRWDEGDIILIETGKFYSWSTYRLINYSRNETVDVELSMTTDWSGRSSHYIVEINGLQGYVRLEDGSTWRMSSYDLSQWRIGDDVIIGLSKDWFSNQYTYLLINPRAKNRIIAMFEF